MIKYVGLIMSDAAKRGESVNAMVMLENTSDGSVSHPVKLYIQGYDCGEWRMCASREYTLSPGEHLHAYLTIPNEYLADTEVDEFIIFAGDFPPETDAQMRGLSAILYIKN